MALEPSQIMDRYRQHRDLQGEGLWISNTRQVNKPLSTNQLNRTIHLISYFIDYFFLKNCLCSAPWAWQTSLSEQYRFRTTMTSSWCDATPSAPGPKESMRMFEGTSERHGLGSRINQTNHQITPSNIHKLISHILQCWDWNKNNKNRPFLLRKRNVCKPLQSSRRPPE